MAPEISGDREAAFATQASPVCADEQHTSGGVPRIKGTRDSREGASVTYTLTHVVQRDQAN